ncbi:glycosyltransferase [Thalassotalea aquiviva]|uniref:glycosyltransferase n=1 Tax=Thalassotalea aquiviva TaxID=3242415 RepID=UPI00352A0D95
MKRVTLFTSLYPNPVNPYLGTFNFQQYSLLAKQVELNIVVPIPWLMWVKNLGKFRQLTTPSHITYFPFFHIPKVLQSFNSFFLFFSVLLSIKPARVLAKSDMVIASFALPDGVCCALLKKLFGFKLLIQCLGTDVNYHSEKAFNKTLLRWAFKQADGVFTVSKNLQTKVTNILPGVRVKTIYNGVNFDKFQLKEARPKTPRTILFIGNLIPTKGVFELIDAANILLKSNPSLRFQFIGNGPEFNNLKKQAAELNISSYIDFLGHQNHDKIVSFIQLADVLILPSHREGVPNVIVEAIACGTPVVATKVGGIPEVVNDKNGILIDTSAPNHIVEGVKLCLQKDWLPAQVRNSISNLTWEQNIAKLTRFMTHCEHKAVAK